MRVAEIICDVFSWGLNNLVPSNLVIISEDFSGVPAFVRAIQRLHHARRCNVLLAHPQTPSGPILNAAIGTQLLWTSLAFGGGPITQSHGGPQKRKSKTKEWLLVH